MTEHNDDPATWPALGRAINWVDRPGNAMKLVKGLAATCALVLMAQLTYTSHPHMAVEGVFGFYAAYGFVMFSGLIFAATLLRVLVKRREDFYAPDVIDTEDYPPEELGLEEADG